MAQQLGDLLNDPSTQATMQGLMKNEIDLTQLPGWNGHNCDEDRLASCESGYVCKGGDGEGRTTSASIHGTVNGRCHVTFSNSDGSGGECHYTGETIQAMRTLYTRQKATVPEALAMSGRMVEECTFKDAKGNPLTFGQMRPAGTSDRKGTVQ